jgi:hypothetical protein
MKGKPDPDSYPFGQTIGSNLGTHCNVDEDALLVPFAGLLDIVTTTARWT